MAVAKFMQRVSTFHYIVHWWIQCYLWEPRHPRGNTQNFPKLSEKRHGKSRKSLAGGGGGGV